MPQSQGWKGSVRWGIAGGNWAEVTTVKDVDPGDGGEAIEATTRANAGFRSYQNGMQEIAPVITVPWDTADTFCAACASAKRAGTLIYLAVLDAAGDGWSAQFIVESIDRPQPLDGAMDATIQFRHGGAASPTWVTAAPTGAVS